MKSIFWIPRAGSGRIGILLRPRGGDWLYNDLREARQERADIIVSALTDWEIEELGLSDEEDCCARQLMRFWRMPIPDRSVPALESTRDFAERAKAELQSNRSILVHCRMGIGRSSLLCASVMVCEGMPPTDIWENITLARGMAVPDTIEQREWIGNLADWIRENQNGT